MEPLGWCFQQKLELGDCDLTIKILVLSVAKLAEQHFLHRAAFTKRIPFSCGLFVFYCTVINFHKGSILKQHRFIIFQFHRSGIWIRSNWAKIKALAWRAGSREDCFLAISICWDKGPTFLRTAPLSSIFKANNGWLSPFHVSNFSCLFFCPPIPLSLDPGKLLSFEGLIWLDWAHPIIQDNLLISKSHNINHILMWEKKNPFFHRR